MTSQVQDTGEDLERRIASRTEELLRTNALLGEEITRHEATEQRLRESGERLAAMINAAPEAVCTTFAPTSFSSSPSFDASLPRHRT